MRTFKFNDYEIIAETWESSRNWGHRALLYKKDMFITKYKATYYNRTWESYQYQSVVKSVILKYIDYLADELFVKYKAKHGLKRLTPTEKSAIIKADDRIAELENWLDEL